MFADVFGRRKILVYQVKFRFSVAYLHTHAVRCEEFGDFEWRYVFRFYSYYRHWWVVFRSSIGDRDSCSESRYLSFDVVWLLHQQDVVAISTHLRPDFVGNRFGSLHIMLHDLYSLFSPMSSSVFVSYFIHIVFLILLLPTPSCTLGCSRCMPHDRPSSLPSCSLRSYYSFPYLCTFSCYARFLRRFHN